VLVLLQLLLLVLLLVLRACDAAQRAAGARA
jgi:hypothetical protein